MIWQTDKFRIDDTGLLWRLNRDLQWITVTPPNVESNTDFDCNLPGLRWEGYGRSLDGNYILTYRVIKTRELIRWIGRDGVGVWDLWRAGGKIEEAYTKAGA